MADPQKKSPWETTINDFSSRGAPDPYGPLMQNDMAERGLFGLPTSGPVTPVDAGGGGMWQDLMRWGQKANNRGEEPVRPAAGVEPPSVPANPAGSPMDPLEEALRLNETDPSKLSPAQLSMLKRWHAIQGMPQGGSTSASSTTVNTSQRIMPKEYKSSLALESMMGEDVAQTIEAQGANRAEAAQDAAVSAHVKGLKLEEIADQRARMQAQNAERIEALQADRAKAQSEYEKAAQEIDPSRLMRGGKKIMGAFAMALGAYGATLGRSQNFAQQIIQDALARDFDQQKMQLGAKREKVTLADKILLDNRARFQDENAALEASKADMLGVLASKQEARALQYQGTEQGLQLKKEAEQTRLAQQTRQTNAMELESVVKNTSTTTQTTPYTQSQATQDFYKEQTARAEAAIKNREAFGQHSQEGAIDVTKLPGVKVVNPGAANLAARDKAQSQGVAETINAYNSMQEALKGMRKLRKEFGVEGKGTDALSNEKAINTFNTLRNQYITGISIMNKQGVIMQHEDAKYEDLAPLMSAGNPLTAGTGWDGVLQRLDGAIESLRTRTNAHLKIAGLELPDTAADSGAKLGLRDRK